jgi:hypothetical protein
MLQFPVERSLNKITTGSIQIPFGIRLKLPEIEYVWDFNLVGAGILRNESSAGSDCGYH